MRSRRNHPRDLARRCPSSVRRQSCFFGHGLRDSQLIASFLPGASTPWFFSLAKQEQNSTTNPIQAGWSAILQRVGIGGAKTARVAYGSLRAAARSRKKL